MDAHRYLDLAKKLVDEVKAGRFLVAGAGGEAECRAAVSRAYYAAYHGAIGFLDQIGFEPGKSHEAHLVLRDELSNAGHVGLRQVGGLLDTLHTERKSADYALRDRRTESARQADYAVGLADRVFNLLDQVRNEPPAVLISITSAVQTYIDQRQTSAIRRKPPKK